MAQSKSEQPEKADPTQDAGEQVPAGTQVSASVNPPTIAQDVQGRPVNIKLDPETGVPERPLGEDEE